MAASDSQVRSTRRTRGEHKEGERLGAEDCGEAFHGLEAEVAFAALEAADVGAVKADEVGEGFLRQALVSADGGDVLADDALQVSLGHDAQALGRAT